MVFEEVEFEFPELLLVELAVDESVSLAFELVLEVALAFESVELMADEVVLVLSVELVALDEDSPSVLSANMMYSLIAASTLGESSQLT